MVAGSLAASVTDCVEEYVPPAGVAVTAGAEVSTVDVVVLMKYAVRVVS
jgi:hypothetical protein